MKIIKHIITIVTWTLISLYAALIILLNVPQVQGFLGAQVSKALSGKFGTEVSIGRVELGLFNRLVIDDVFIYDRQGKEMLRAARLAVKIELIPLAKGRVSISSAQVFSAHANLYKRSASEKINCQFLIDSLASKDTTSHGNLDLRINSLIMRRSSVEYNRYDIAPSPSRLNPNHLKITDISAHIILKVLKEDSLNINVKRIALKEQSGIDIKKLSLMFEGGKSGSWLSGLHMELPSTVVSISEMTAAYDMDNGEISMPSLKFQGRMDKSTITLSDLASVVPALNNFNDAISISSAFHGSGDDLHITRFNAVSASDDISINANGWVKDLGPGASWNANINDMSLPEEVIFTILQNSGMESLEEKPIGKMLANMGCIRLRGNVYTTVDKSMEAKGTMMTGIGKLSFSLSLGKNHGFSGGISANEFELGHLIGKESVGKVSASLRAKGKLETGHAPKISIEGTAEKLEYNNYAVNNISIDGSYDGNNIRGRLKVNDSNMDIDVEGALKKTDGFTAISLTSSVRRFCPKAINMTEKWGDAAFSLNVNANLMGTGINDAKGNVKICDMRMESADDTLSIDNIEIKSGDFGNERFVAMESDFGNAELKGNFEYKMLPQSVINIIGESLPTLPGFPQIRSVASNDFSLRIHITDTEWAKGLLGIPLTVNSPIDLSASVNDSKRDIAVLCHADDFTYGETNYRNGSIEIKSVNDTLLCNIGVTQARRNGRDMEFRLLGNGSDNKLSTSLTWNNNSDNGISGELNTIFGFYCDNEGKHVADIKVMPSHININNDIWNVMPSSITYSGKSLSVDRFALMHNNQHVIINGKASAVLTDSLIIDLNGIDIGYVLELVNFHSVEFNGLANGQALIIAPFGELSAVGNIKVENFTFEDGRMGILNATVSWNKQEKQIDINAIANDGPDAMTLIHGYVSPERNCLDINIDAAGTHIDFIKSFTETFMSDVNGQAYGNARIVGQLKQLDLLGTIVVNGEATITPVNCKYYMRNDTIEFVRNEIKIVNAPIYDVNGNVGTVRGSLYHNHLKDLSYAIDVEANNLLAYNFADFGEYSFFGTIYASGDVGINGRRGDVNIDINATPLEGSVFVYNVSTPNDIVTQEFITWNDATKTDTAAYTEKPHATLTAEDTPSDIHINFLLNCTPDLTVKLLMDAQTDDYITLNGEGSIRASFFNKGDFSMFGTYTITQGTYGITIQDIIKKNFVFNEGSSITFSGNPYDAQLNLQAVYTVNGVSLSDLNVGNSFTNNTIRVNCLMNISGQPQNPEISFDLDLPTVSSDEKQMIKSIINSEDEMNQQVVYLLGIGRFYPQSANNSAAQSEEQKNQTSLAMQSLLSGTISTQINHVLSSVIKSNNWNFGANISTGDEGWNNAEYEGLLSGRLLNNRLLINGQFGYRDNANTANTSFIGDFDIRYLLKPNGNISLKVYNQTNDRYFTKSSLNTQGIGLIMKKDFNGMKDLLNIRKKKEKEPEKE